MLFAADICYSQQQLLDEKFTGNNASMVIFIANDIITSLNKCWNYSLCCLVSRRKKKARLFAQEISKLFFELVMKFDRACQVARA